LTTGEGQEKRIIGLVTINKKEINDDNYGINVFFCENLVLAAGGPGELYKTTVYPKEQFGMHAIAFKAGLAAENLTESQFGLASIKFRWNVSGTYMQVMPRIFSSDEHGKDEKDFLADLFPTTSKMATAIFLKGYQWPFDPERIENSQSSLIDMLVFNETQRGRRVFLDFSHDPAGSASMGKFELEKLDNQAYQYLQKANALQSRPIDRLAQMNPLAIEIYKENGIDLYNEPLEIALCAQHNNGGMAVDKWWQSNIAQTFVIGEMAGTHGVKRPGGSALNAGQVGGLRAAEYIVNKYPLEIPEHLETKTEIKEQLIAIIAELQGQNKPKGFTPQKVIDEIQQRMTDSAGHIRQLDNAQKALKEAIGLFADIQKNGFNLRNAKEIITAINAEHLVLTSIAYLKAITELLKQDSGSRGSHLVLADEGIEIHPDIIDQATQKPLRFKPENKTLRNHILQIQMDEDSADLFSCKDIVPRTAPVQHKAFEQAWKDYRQGKIYTD